MLFSNTVVLEIEVMELRARPLRGSASDTPSMGRRRRGVEGTLLCDQKRYQRFEEIGKDLD